MDPAIPFLAIGLVGSLVMSPATCCCTSRPGSTTWTEPFAPMQGSCATCPRGACGREASSGPSPRSLYVVGFAGLPLLAEGDLAWLAWLTRGTALLRPHLRRRPTTPSTPTSPSRRARKTTPSSSRSPATSWRSNGSRPSDVRGIRSLRHCRRRRADGAPALGGRPHAPLRRRFSVSYGCACPSPPDACSSGVGATSCFHDHVRHDAGVRDGVSRRRWATWSASQSNAMGSAASSTSRQAAPSVSPARRSSCWEGARQREHPAQPGGALRRGGPRRAGGLLLERARTAARARGGARRKRRGARWGDSGRAASGRSASTASPRAASLRCSPHRSSPPSRARSPSRRSITSCPASQATAGSPRRECPSARAGPGAAARSPARPAGPRMPYAGIVRRLLAERQLDMRFVYERMLEGATEGSAIKVERIGGPVMLVCPERDAMWPATMPPATSRSACARTATRGRWSA